MRPIPSPIATELVEDWKLALLMECRYLRRPGICLEGFYYCGIRASECVHFDLGGCDLPVKCRYAVPACMMCPELESRSRRAQWLFKAVRKSGNPWEWFPVGPVLFERG
jgi:hypothetical protein